MRANAIAYTLTMVVGCAAGPAAADVDWANIPLKLHSEYQAVNASGGSVHSGFPVRLRGVILNNPEDWLNPAANSFFDPGSWLMGGEWEIFVQAVDPGDFGGTAAWIGQNYGNSYRGDADFSYTNEQWLAEVARLDYAGEDPATAPRIRAGDYIEIRARAGLNYQGKMNVNEQHDNDPGKDFDVVLLERGLGLPAPAVLSLADLKDDANSFIFDPTRATGGELHQATRVQIDDVRFTADSLAGFGPNRDLMLEDLTGRTLGIHIGLNDSFTTMLPPEGFFSVVGILDQKDPTGRGGYRLLAMNAADFVVPEPASMLWAGAGVLLLVHRRHG